MPGQRWMNRLRKRTSSAQGIHRAKKVSLVSRRSNNIVSAPIPKVDFPKINGVDQRFEIGRRLDRRAGCCLDGVGHRATLCVLDVS